MKKKYLIVAAFCSMTWTNVQAQIISEDFESYSVGDYMGVESADWTTSASNCKFPPVWRSAPSSIHSTPSHVLFVSGVVTSNSTTQNSSAFQLNSRLSASHDPMHSCPNELKAEFKQNRIMMTIIICRCKPGMRMGYEKMGGFVTCPFILSQLFTIVENGCGFTVDFQRYCMLGF